MTNLCLLLYPVITVAAATVVSSALAYGWLRQARHNSDFDPSSRLLIYLLVVAIFSMGAFLIYLFVHVRSC
jgi:hypothetical protein